MGNIGVIDLPVRSNALTYEDAEIRQVAALLTSGQVQHGQGVAIDEAQDSEARARNRGRLMRDYLATEEYGSLSTRARIVKIGAGTEADPEKFIPAVSLRATADEPDEDPVETPEQEPEKSNGKGK